jgi:hypothetical protein
MDRFEFPSMDDLNSQGRHSKAHQTLDNVLLPREAQNSLGLGHVLHIQVGARSR